MVVLIRDRNKVNLFITRMSLIKKWQMPRSGYFNARYVKTKTNKK